MICAVFALVSIHALQRIIDVCHSYASSHNITFNCQKTLGLSFASRNFKLNIKPNVVLGDFKMRFVNGDMGYSYL